ncbi:MAG TPA: CBS domain-containing protein, partial [Fimbriimonadaceae bacterium]|nr:CBS domain-containing protein [Fimbriimonadaceae bacterium]
MEPIHPLSQPVGASMRFVEALESSASIGRAAATLRESASSFLPVLENGRLIGVVTDRSLAGALAGGLGPLTSVHSALAPNLPGIHPSASGAEALRRLAELDAHELAVVDADGRFLGVLSASDLFPRVSLTPPLPMIGGMATPFGVYLTAGG